MHKRLLKGDQHAGDVAFSRRCWCGVEDRELVDDVIAKNFKIGANWKHIIFDNDNSNYQGFS